MVEASFFKKQEIVNRRLKVAFILKKQWRNTARPSTISLRMLLATLAENPGISWLLFIIVYCDSRQAGSSLPRCQSTQPWANDSGGSVSVSPPLPEQSTAEAFFNGGASSVRISRVHFCGFLNQRKMMEVQHQLELKGTLIWIKAIRHVWSLFLLLFSLFPPSPSSVIRATSEALNNPSATKLSFRKAKVIS